MNTLLSRLTSEEIDFIMNELGLSNDRLKKMTEDELEDVYNKICDIEVAEVPLTDDIPESERCRIASDIVTLLGSVYAVEDNFKDYDDNF